MSRRHSTGSKHDKHGSRGSGRSKGKEPASSSSGSQRTQQPPLSFLFMVNELAFDTFPHDDYHHGLPPQHPSDYTDEIQSRVMRYANGRVEEAPGYQWMRPEKGAEGVLWWDRAVDEYGERTRDPQTGQYWHPEKYKSFGVFACNPLLPIMVADVDPLEMPTHSKWQLLQLFHPRDLEGLTQVATEDSDMGRREGQVGPGLVRYAAGHRASWIPGLLPSVYRRPWSDIRSTGLGGELPIVLGLMAFSDGGPADETFLGRRGHHGRWQSHRWMHEGPPTGCPQTAQEPPRGFLVVVFLDPENLEGSTYDQLHAFEWYHAIVQG